MTVKRRVEQHYVVKCPRFNRHIGKSWWLYVSPAACLRCEYNLGEVGRDEVECDYPEEDTEDG